MYFVIEVLQYNGFTVIGKEEPNMVSSFREWFRRRADRKKKAQQRTAADPGEALRQAKDNTWTGMATDARRNHPGVGSAPTGAGRR